MRGGLLPLPRSEADLSLGALFSPPTDVPSQFTLPFYEYYAPKNQEDTDFCTAFACTSAMELTEEERLSPEFFFACSKLLTGDPDEWGQNIRDAAQTARKHGALESDKAPFSLSTNDASFLRRIENWGDLTPLLNNAIVHKQLGFANCKGSKDGFDNIKDWIWKFQKPVVLGVEWGWPPHQAYIDELSQGYGHCILAVGWKNHDGKEYLVIQNSWGENGEGGKFYLGRQVINENVSRFGALMFTDISAEDARHYMDNGIKADQPWTTQFIIQMYKLTIGKLVELLEITKAQIMIDQKKLETMAEAIKEFEGWSEGSRSWRNNNPGNLRWSKFQDGVRNGFSYFKDYETGWKALLFQIEIAFDGRSKAYKPTDTILKFFQKYAPSSDNNHPEVYAKYVADKLAVDVGTTLFDSLKRT